MTADDAIVEVLRKVGGWVRLRELRYQLAKRGIEMSEDAIFERCFELEAGGRLRSALWFQAREPAA